MDIQIISPVNREGQRGRLLSLIGGNGPNKTAIAEVQWQDGRIEELSSVDYQWTYLPTNVNGYDNWSMFGYNNEVTSDYDA